MKDNLELKKVTVLCAIVMFLVVTIGIGYASLSTNLKIEGTTEMSNVKWDVHFLEPVVSEGSVTAVENNDVTDSYEEGTTNLNYKISLATPGEFYEFKVKVENTGTIDAKLNSVTIDPLSDEDDVYLNYTVLDGDGNTPTTGTVLNAGDTEEYTIRVEFESNLNNDNGVFEISEKSVSLNYNMTYVQAD